jgi:HEAT repeat protein
MQHPSWVLILIFLYFSYSNLYGENNPDWVVPGEMSRGDRLLLAQAITADPGMKIRVVEELAHRARAGVLSQNDINSLFILRHLAEEGVRTKVITAPGRNFPEVRRAACEVLGLVGGARSAMILVSVLETEQEPMVLSEAVFALAKTGVPPEKNIIELLTRIIETRVLPRVDNNLAFACLLSIEKFGSLGTGIDDPSLFRAVIRIADGPFIGDVRRRALAVLDNLRGVY